MFSVLPPGHQNGKSFSGYIAVTAQRAGAHRALSVLLVLREIDRHVSWLSGIPERSLTPKIESYMSKLVVAHVELVSSFEVLLVNATVFDRITEALE